MQVHENLPYVERGQGEVTVVFLHGLFGSPDNWSAIMEDLEEDFHLVAPEFPLEAAAAINPKAFQSITQLTELVKAFLDELQLDKVVLCGNSLGGQVSIDFSLRYPQRVDRLVLSGSAGLFERSLFGGYFPRATREFVEERIREVFHDERHVTEELIVKTQRMLADRNNKRLLIRVAKASREHNVKGELHRLDVPTLIVWGEHDKVTPPAVAEEFQEAIRGAQLAMLPECGHSPPIEQPEEFSRLLREFIGQDGARRSLRFRPR